MKLEMWQWYLLLTLLCLVIQGFFAMLEMACVSFNKVRLQYYISQGQKRAIWLNYLLNHPALLFGTTLIMVNAALLIGSECSRKFYESIGFNPSLAPITQVFLVLVFAEISPMFAGRRYAEHAAKVGVPVLYLCAMLLRPFIMLLDLLCKLINKLIGSSIESGLYLTREELQNIIEEREENYFTSEEKPEFTTAVSNIFTLKNKTAKEVMKPIAKVPMIPYGASVEELRFMLSQKYVPYIPIYKKETDNIVAIAYPRDLLRLEGSDKVREMARSPWFITEGNSVIQILKQFRKNNKSVAVVLNDSGHATGLLTLDDVIDAIFGRIDEWVSTGDTGSKGFHIAVDKTFPGDMEIAEFNKKYGVHLEFKNAKTLAEAIIEALGHAPAKGETVRIDQFELTVDEVTLLHIKSVQVRTTF